jgi:branched-chain amino acid transport system substrate-binding protein
MRSGTAKALGLVLVAGLSLAACSSSGQSSTSGATVAGSAATGTPVKVVLTSTFSSATATNVYPEVQGAVQAHVDAFNKAGGAHGHPIDLIVCNDQGDANVATDCAQQAVTQKAVAMIGVKDTFGAEIIPVLQAAGIPYVADSYVPTDTQASNAFMLDGSQVTYPAVAQVLAQSGCKKAAVTAVDTPGGHIAAPEAQKVIESYGVQVVAVQYLPAIVPDYSSTVSGLLSKGMDCLEPLSGSAEVAKFMTALHQSGANVKVFGASAAFTPQVVSQLGPIAEGVKVLSFANHDTPQAKAAAAEIKEYAGSNAKISDNALLGWAYAKILLDSMNTITGDITAGSVLHALASLKTVNTGVLPPINFTINYGFKEYPRYWTYQMFEYTVQNGTLVLNQPNPTNVLPAVKIALG